MRIAVFLLAAGIAHGAVSDLAVVYDRIPSGETEGKVAILNIGGSVLGASITFTAAGAWAVTKNTCNSNFKFNPTSGTAGAQTVRVMPDDIASQSISAGQNQVTGTCTGDVDGTGFTIRWLVRRSRQPFVTDQNGNQTWSGCSAHNALHAYQNYCPFTADYPPQDGVTLPAVGDAITDPRYGGVGLVMSRTTRQPYGSYAYNRDETLFITSDGIRSTADASIVANLPATTVCDSYSTMWWDYRENGVANGGWCFEDGTPVTIKKWHISGGVVVDDGVTFTHTHDLADHGSSGMNINWDAWITFPDTNGKFVFLHLPTNTTYSDTIEHTTRSTNISPFPDADGCLYGHQVSSLLGGVNDEDLEAWKVCNGVLTKVPRATRIDGGWIFGDNWGSLAGYGCTYATSDCMRAGHQTAFYVNGNSGRISGGGSGQLQARSFLYGQYACMFSNGPDACYPRELGGGGQMFITGHAESYGGCAPGSPICVGSQVADDSRVRKVTATESGGTCTGTVDGTNNFTNGQRVLFQHFSVSAWNVHVTLGTSSGSTITFPCTGAGTAVVGYATPSTFVSGDDPARSHIIACRADNLHCKLIAKWCCRSNANPAGDVYNTTGLVQTSARGTFVALNQGLGAPGTTGPVQWRTGFEGCTERTKPNDFCGGGGLRVIPLSDTTARAIVTTPYAGGTCTLAWGTTLDYSGATTQALSAGTTAREYTIPALTASTHYYLNVKCDGVFQGTARTNWHYAIDEMTTLAAAPGGSVAYSFLLPPAPTGSATYQVEFGTTSGLGTQTGDVCTVGQKCMVSLSLSHGVLYYRYKWLDGGSATLRETPIISRVLR